MRDIDGNASAPEERDDESQKTICRSCAESLIKYPLFLFPSFRAKYIYSFVLETRRWEQGRRGVVAPTILCADKSYGEPVWKLLGGKVHDEISLYATGWHLEPRGT